MRDCEKSAQVKSLRTAEWLRRSARGALQVCSNAGGGAPPPSPGTRPGVARLEPTGNTPSNYITTSSAQVIRPTDVCCRSNSDALIKEMEGFLFVESVALYDSGAPNFRCWPLSPLLIKNVAVGVARPTNAQLQAMAA
jgi:hypothetical protein